MKRDQQRRRGRPTRVPATVVGVRRFIAGANLRPYDQLPPEQELAGTLGVSPMTLRKALAELAAAGVLERRHGVGTFIRQPVVRRIGVAYRESTFYLPISDFVRQIYRQIQDWGAARGIGVCLLPRHNDGPLTGDAVQLLEDRAIDGVLGLTGFELSQLAAALEPYQVPLVYTLVRAEDPIAAPYVAHRTTARTGLNALRQRGCEYVGLLGTHYARRNVDRQEALRIAAAEGLRVTSRPVFGNRDVGDDAVGNGRELARQWLATADRPHALIAADPYEVRGFLYELLGPHTPPVAMPEIAMLEADESIIDLPWPVIRVRVSLWPVVATALEMLDLLMRGETPAAPHLVIDPEASVLVPESLRPCCAAN